MKTIENYTKKELDVIARNMDITGRSKLKKNELYAKIEQEFIKEYWTNQNGFDDDLYMDPSHICAYWKKGNASSLESMTEDREWKTIESMGHKLDGEVDFIDEIGYFSIELYQTILFFIENEEDQIYYTLEEEQPLFFKIGNMRAAIAPRVTEEEDENDEYEEEMERLEEKKKALEAQEEKEKMMRELDEKRAEIVHTLNTNQLQNILNKQVDLPSEVHNAIMLEFNEYPKYFEFDLKIRFKYGLLGTYLTLAMGHKFELWEKYNMRSNRNWCYGDLSTAFNEVVQGWSRDHPLIAEIEECEEMMIEIAPEKYEMLI